MHLAKRRSSSPPLFARLFFRRSLWETIAVRRIWILALILFSLPVFADDSPWEKAFSLQQAGKYEEAASLWLLTLSGNQPAGDETPAKSSAHWNLGLCCVHLQLPECVSYHWLQSIKQSTSLSHIARVTQGLSKFQNSLGLPVSATTSPTFLVAANVGAGHSFIALILAGWLCFAGLIGLGRARNVPRFVWFATATVALAWGGFAHFSQQQLGHFVSLGNDGKDVPIYSTDKQESPLASLPAGTVAYIENLNEVGSSSRLQVSSPVPGWISAGDVSRPISEMKGFLRGAKHSAAR